MMEQWLGDIHSERYPFGEGCGMRYVDDSKQELLVSTTQFPALVIAHQSYDKARYHWHSGLEVLYAKDSPCPS